MKRTLIALTCIVMFAGLAKAQEQEPFDYPQSWEETKESAPKDLELVVCNKNPYVDLTDNTWHFRVKAVDADGNEVGMVDKRTGQWVAAGNGIKITATLAQINTLYETVTGANMAVKLQKALLKAAVLTLKP